jgi:aminodeoxyfutalosine deaminase
LSKWRTLQDTIAILPEWILPLDAEPILNGCLVLHRGRVEYVGKQLPSKYQSVMQLPIADVAILPGLINSHCHLEFSDLESPIAASDTFPDWIRRVLAVRRQSDSDAKLQTETRRTSIVKGIRESYDCGVRLIVDMITEPWDADWLKECQTLSASLPSAFITTEAHCVEVQPCVELIDVTSNRWSATMGFLDRVCEAQTTFPIRIGLAPHAPYTASLQATEVAASRSLRDSRLLSMHLAESQEEMIWLQQGQGPFASLMEPFVNERYLKSLGGIDSHLRLLSDAWRALVIHGNYLTDSELHQIADNRASMALVHCPRTHRHFGHKHDGTAEYPMPQRTALHVQHFLGTDSRASNPDLNIWREAQEVRLRYSSMDANAILRMITHGPANFLALGNLFGSLKIGSSSWLTAIELNGQRADHSLIENAVLHASTRSRPLEAMYLEASGR